MAPIEGIVSKKIEAKKTPEPRNKAKLIKNIVKAKVNLSKNRNKPVEEEKPGNVEDFFPEENNEEEIPQNEEINEDIGNDENQDYNQNLEEEVPRDEEPEAEEKQQPASKNTLKKNADKFKMVSRVTATLGKKLEGSKKKINNSRKRKIKIFF